MIRPIAMLATILAGLMVAGVPATAQTEPVPAAPTVGPIPADGGRYPQAYKIAQILHNKQSTLEETAHLFTDEGIAQMQQNPDIAGLERKYPGVTKYMFNAARPELEQQVIDSLPTLWNSIAHLLAAEMTSAELAQVSSYYTSSAGQHLLSSARRNFDYRTQLTAIAKDPDAPIDPKDIRTGLRNGLPAMIHDISAADKAALLLFMRTSAFTKIQKLNPRVLQLTAAWSSQSDPERQGKIDKIMVEAAGEYMDRSATGAK